MVGQRTAIIVSDVRWPNLPTPVAAGITALAAEVDAIAVGAIGAGSGLRTLPVSLDRPLELSLARREEVRAEELLYVAVGFSADTATITRAIPTVYLDLGHGPTEARQALIERASTVIGGSKLAAQFGRHPNTVIEIDTLAPAELRQAVLGAEPPVDRSPLHRCLSAETFNRTTLAIEEAPAVTMVSAYVRDRIHDRLEIERHRGVGDVLDELAHVVATGRQQTPPAHRFRGVYATIARIHRHKDAGSLLSDPMLGDAEVASVAIRRFLQHRALSLLTDASELTEESLQRLEELLPDTERVDFFGPDQVVAAARLRKAPLRLLARIRDEAGPEAALAARFELIRLAGSATGWVEPELFDQMLDEVDELSWHPSLFQAGLRYWSTMVGDEWGLDGPSEMPPIAAHGEPLPLDQVAHVEAEAKSATARGDYTASIQLFEQVRLASLTHQNHPVTTEIAARMNIAWARWERGDRQEQWQPYISSALADVKPRDELMRLRHRIKATRDEIASSPGGRNLQLDSDLRAYIEAGVVDPGAVISHIDSLAVRRGVWRAGIAHFQAITGDQWTGAVAIKRRNNVLLHLWRGAWRRIDRVYVRQLHRRSKLVTADRLLRLQIARRKAKLGLPPAWWQPTFAKILQENGPPDDLVAVRAAAVAPTGELP